MLLSELLKGVVSVVEDRQISGLSLDSRRLKAGELFIALTGATQHGLMHVGQAIERGACAVVFDPAGAGMELAGQVSTIPKLPVEDLGLKLGEIAARFYGHPSRRLSVIGITGTNGKTSCSQFLSQVLDDCGIIGTLGWGEWGSLKNTVNTTPDAVAVHCILAELVKEKKQFVAMEVSSHGLEQGRVNGVCFQGAVLTNISRDHLDYHGSMEAYVQAKLTLFEKTGLGFAVVNLDTDYSSRIMTALPEGAALWGFSVKGKMSHAGESLVAENIGHQAEGIEFDVRWRNQIRRVKAPLFGDFNIENIMTVLTVMLALNYSLDESVKRVSFLKPVPGRMERFGGEGDPVVFVDYAHTPDALGQVLASVRKHCNAALWVVFGCGGNRDKGKRPEMGARAEQWADHIVITDDNPRFENAQEIVSNILSGCRSNKIEVTRDREAAIRSAIIRANANDAIVIAGKGHESYQEIKGVKHPFNDAIAVKAALKLRTDHNANVVE